MGKTATVTMTAGSITGNNVSYKGKSEYSSGGGGVAIDVKMSGTTVDGGGKFTMEGGKIKDNTITNENTDDTGLVVGEDVLVKWQENRNEGPFFNKISATVGSEVVYQR